MARNQRAAQTSIVGNEEQYYSITTIVVINIQRLRRDL